MGGYPVMKLKLAHPALHSSQKPHHVLQQRSSEHSGCLRDHYKTATKQLHTAVLVNTQQTFREILAGMLALDDRAV